MSELLLDKKMNFDQLGLQQKYALKQITAKSQRLQVRPINF